MGSFGLLLATSVKPLMSGSPSAYWKMCGQMCNVSTTIIILFIIAMQTYSLPSTVLPRCEIMGFQLVHCVRHSNLFKKMEKNTHYFLVGRL